MPITTIYDDAISRPELFKWFGPDPALLKSWLAALPLRAHPSLVEFWRRTGGGDIFESETLLGPLAVEGSDNLLEMNGFHRDKGLPDGMLLFHIGFCLSASSVDRKRHRNRLITLEPGSYRITGSFDTFNGWYQSVLRSEFAPRYGL